MALTLRIPKGSRLTKSEVDANFVHCAPTSGTTQQNLDLVDPRGRHTIWVPAAAMVASTTAGAAAATTETATNKIMLKTLDFADGASVLHAQFSVQMPKSWNDGVINAQFVWTANSVSTNAVVWGIKAVSIADDAALDAAFGTGVTVTDANKATAYDLNISDESGDVTVAGAGAQEWVVFDVYRDPTDAADTLAATASLLGVSVFFDTDAATDD